MKERPVFSYSEKNNRIILKSVCLNNVKMYFENNSVFLDYDVFPGFEKINELFLEAGLGSIWSDLKTKIESKEQGKPVEILKRTETKTFGIRIDVDKEGMSVSIIVDPVIGGMAPLETDVKDFLKKNHVVFGTDLTEYKTSLENREFGSYIAVASGVPVEHGKNAIIQVKEELFTKREPVENDKGEIDFKEIGSVRFVKKGDVLAEKIPATPGVEGVTVRNKKIPAKPGKDSQFPGSSGTEISEDGKYLTAAIDGHLERVNGRIKILPVFTVEGDVDYSSGNIEFPGSVVVNGAVKSGFSVKGENVTINGIVEGACIEAEKNVTVNGGVNGGGKAKIKAGGNVNVMFADQCEITAGADIIAKNSLTHSSCMSGGSIKVFGGKKSMITGGKYSAGSEISCHHLGGEMGTKTEVICGFNPGLKIRYEELLEKKYSLEKDFQKAEMNISYLKEMEISSGLNEDKRKLLVSLTKILFTLKNELNIIKETLEATQKEMESNKTKAIIRIKQKCYSGVFINIRGVTYKTSDENRYCSYVFEEGEIKMKSYDYLEKTTKSLQNE